MFRVCHAFFSVHYSLVVTYWERANFLALLYVMLYCVFVTFPCGILGQVWYFIVLIPDLCLLPYLEEMSFEVKFYARRPKTGPKSSKIRPVLGFL